MPVPEGLPHDPVLPALQVTQMFPCSSVLPGPEPCALRVSLATMLAVFPEVQVQGVPVAAPLAVPCPNSRKSADEPPPAAWTVWAFDMLGITQSATASTIKHFTNFIFPPQFLLRVGFSRRTGQQLLCLTSELM